MISGPECKHIGSSDSYFCNKKKLNRLKINNSEIHQRIEATGKIAAPKLERQIQRITAYQNSESAKLVFKSEGDILSDR